MARFEVKIDGVVIAACDYSTKKRKCDGIVPHWTPPPRPEIIRAKCDAVIERGEVCYADLRPPDGPTYYCPTCAKRNIPGII